VKILEYWISNPFHDSFTPLPHQIKDETMKTPPVNETHLVALGGNALIRQGQAKKGTSFSY